MISQTDNRHMHEKKVVLLTTYHDLVPATKDDVKPKPTAESKDAMPTTAAAAASAVVLPVLEHWHHPNSSTVTEQTSATLIL